MRKITIAAAAIAAALIASSCENLGLYIGNGTVTSETRSVAAFTSIRVTGSGTLRVHKGDQQVTVTSDSNIVPKITTSVSGTKLTIGIEPFTSICDATKLEYDVTLPSLEGVDLAGSGDIVVDAFAGSSFSGNISGSGNITADLAYDSAALSCTGSGDTTAKITAASLSYDCSGSGKASFTGTATKVKLSIAGSGSVNAQALTAKDASIGISGSGSVAIRATGVLATNITGSGSVRYWGSPAAVNTSGSGSGSVSRAGD
jgi:hypothetical protein